MYSAWSMRDCSLFVERLSVRSLRQRYSSAMCFSKSCSMVLRSAMALSRKKEDAPGPEDGGMSARPIPTRGAP
eukprot:15402970-Alexandrium_andersonii.AAC.1